MFLLEFRPLCFGKLKTVTHVNKIKIYVCGRRVGGEEDWGRGPPKNWGYISLAFGALLT